MTECSQCGRDTGAGAFYPGDSGDALCRGCYDEFSPSRRARTRGDREAANHDEQASRQRVIDNDRGQR